MRWFFGLFWALATLPAAWAEGESGAPETTAPPPGRWHHVAPNSPFYSPDMAHLRMAAILQEDGSFGRIVLGETGQGAYVTLGLPGGVRAAPSLRSQLVFGNGARVTRTIQNTALDRLAMPGADMMIYSFSVAAEDISAFRRAVRWIVTPADAEPVTITLAGSSGAIAAAQEIGLQIAEPDAEAVEGRPVLTGLPGPWAP